MPNSSIHLSETQLSELLHNLHSLDKKDMPDVRRQSLIDDLAVISWINGTDDPSRQMDKRILFSMARNTIQQAMQHKEERELADRLHKEEREEMERRREEDAKAHIANCPLSSAKAVVVNGVAVQPLEHAVRTMLAGEIPKILALQTKKEDDGSESSILFAIPFVGTILQGKGRAATVIAVVATIATLLGGLTYILNRNLRSMMEKSFIEARIEASGNAFKATAGRAATDKKIEQIEEKIDQ